MLDTTLRSWHVAGLVLIAIGLDRLLSAYLVSDESATLVTRLFIGAFCTIRGLAWIASARVAAGRQARR